MIEWVMLTVGVLSVLCAWDGFRRYVEAARMRQEEQDRIVRIERELGRLESQVQTVLSRMQAAQASQATRVPRIAR